MPRNSTPVAQVSFLLAGTLLVMTCLAPVCAGKEKIVSRTGQDVFKQYCASCHVGGGNSAKPTKPIAGSDVLKSIATFQKYLEDPPGHMPYYKSIVSDKTLVKKLYEYCRKLKKVEQA